MRPAARNAGVNVLPSPLASVIFHFHKSDVYEPEYVTAVEPNRKTSEVDRLLTEYGARPKGLAAARSQSRTSTTRDGWGSCCDPGAPGLTLAS